MWINGQLGRGSAIQHSAIGAVAAAIVVGFVSYASRVLAPMERASQETVRALEIFAENQSFCRSLGAWDETRYRQCARSLAEVRDNERKRVIEELATAF